MGFASDLTQVQDGHIRLAVLRLLDEQPGYQANDSVLHSAVGAMGLNCTRDQMRGHLAWLAEQRMITTIEIAAGLTVATLTERGGDVANGRSQIKGVQRPSPKGG
ncbi:MAG: ArsR family transcriptional regulator [Sphingomonadales bacterium]|nr:ArsR family transcriptional regulator [Sphingomonadales bacterium]MBD3772107.1 ArsR family transcriptional regulator [Paracoccaceae bacterium]